MGHQLSGRKFCIVGGAGFIGSHFTDVLLGDPSVAGVTLFDNFSSGREWHYQQHLTDKRFKVVRGDVKDLPALKKAMDGHDTVIHLASNPDIARAATEPTIDFDEGTLLTNHVVEAMRCTSAKRLLYASGSGVYGDLGTVEAQEDHGPLMPSSTYGASKLAGEALLASYVAMFGLTGCAFRFGNVVGPRQTHGVGYDFVRRLLKDPTQLRILGDGSQSKSYIYVRDVVSAVLWAHDHCEKPFEAYNVATGDYITVREIAELTLEILELSPKSVDLQFGDTPRGWKGDVPIVRLNTDRIQRMGWRCSLPTRRALEESIRAMIPDAKAGRL
ncbi:NAD-dependent epimerase/dehydratase family protein [bacterium]|nr:NAD-dependent epimerase/dehydratase family protein [bacterium]